MTGITKLGLFWGWIPESSAPFPTPSVMGLFLGNLFDCDRAAVDGFSST